MTQQVTLEEGFKLMRQTLEEIKDCPISQEEMVEKAEKTLRIIYKNF